MVKHWFNTWSIDCLCWDSDEISNMFKLEFTFTKSCYVNQIHIVRRLFYGSILENYFNLFTFKHLQNQCNITLLRKAKMQYLLTCKVSGYCLLALHGRITRKLGQSRMHDRIVRRHGNNRIVTLDQLQVQDVMLTLSFSLLYQTQLYKWSYFQKLNIMGNIL